MRIFWNESEPGSPRRRAHQPRAIAANTTTPDTIQGSLDARLGVAAAREAAGDRLPELAEAESASYSDSISRSSRARSFMDWSRWSGLFCRQRRIRRRT